MFLSPPQLESVLLKRLEQLQGLPNAPALGISNCLRSALQAHTSAAGLEWSSTDSHDEGHQETIQVDLSNPALTVQLGAWGAFVAASGIVAKAQYLAATHALVQDVLSYIIEGDEPAVSRVALDSAWEEDAGSGAEALSPDRFRSSLASLATACSSDAAAQTAAACLARLLERLQGNQKRWKDLLQQYAAPGGTQPGTGEAAAPADSAADDATAASAASMAAGTAAAEAAAAAKTAAADDAAQGDASGSRDAAAAVAANDGRDDGLGALLGGEKDGKELDVAPASDKSTPAAAAGPTEEAGDDAGAATAAVGPATREEDSDDDDSISLGLSRAPSHTSTAPSQEQVGPSAVAGPAEGKAAAARRAAARAISVKSVEDPELRRALSETSSADLDELPPEDFDAVLQRRGSHARASTRRDRTSAPTHAAIGGAEAGGAKGHLTDMDLRAWAALKDKQQQPVAAAAQRGRLSPGPGPSGAAMPRGRGDAARQATDQHLKGERGAQGAAAVSAAGPILGPVCTPLHAAAIGSSGSNVRLSMDRAGGGGAVNAVSRHGSNDTPTRLRTLGTHLSRKLSISEPGPMGQQAEWKHLPALGQASRLHPPEARKPSCSALRAVVQSRGRGDATTAPAAGAAAPGEEKLPVLPALAGARGQPPKAMEFLRRPSMVQRSDAHHADSGGAGGANGKAPANAHLPGLGPPSKQGTQGRPRALSVVQAKKSFRGDSNF